uniref:Uncharacterized protein n=1 Tax=Anopheles atroparvus TaxID=41427 RepID=A0AAG5D0W4_ANOAO
MSVVMGKYGHGLGSCGQETRTETNRGHVVVKQMTNGVKVRQSAKPRVALSEQRPACRDMEGRTNTQPVGRDVKRDGREKRGRVHITMEDVGDQQRACVTVAVFDADQSQQAAPGRVGRQGRGGVIQESPDGKTRELPLHPLQPIHRGDARRGPDDARVV